MYKCHDKNNPFITRKGERITNLDKFAEMLKQNNIPFTREQYEEAKKHLEQS
ncbi:hypothetical protein [uncultured Clostridium sp.]|uniref:hypothetical protein n=1 Tax=uncultured Clostridium sp. TaxID=59620 RepID=UPI002632D1CA|nr:hypothetical protein [uncultured Clostridium sp.]